MRTIFDSITVNWHSLIIPGVVFVVSIIALFWLRKFVLDKLGRWSQNTGWSIGPVLVPTLKVPLSLFCLVTGIYLGLQTSSLSERWKVLVGYGLWSLFIVAIALLLLILTNKIVSFYSLRYKIPERVELTILNIVRVLIFILAALLILGIWGAPTNPLLLLVAIIIFIGILAFRDAMPNFFASFQIAAMQEFKKGDFIKLDSSEEGYITDIRWNHTRLRGLDGGTIMVPNYYLIQRKVINYGRPLKRAKEPFYFKKPAEAAYLCTFAAYDLREFVEALRQITPDILYFHTFDSRANFKNSPNDFALWLTHNLGEKELGQEIAQIDSSAYSIEGLRSYLIQTIEKHIK